MVRNAFLCFLPITVSNSKMVIFQPLTGKGIFLSCFELYSGFFHLDELNLGDNNEAAGNNACGFAVIAVFLLTTYSTINFFVVLPIVIV